METVNYAQQTGLLSISECILAGAAEKTSRKDPDNPRQYWQVIVEPLEGGDPLYLFSDQDTTAEAAKALQSAGGKVKVRASLRTTRSGTRFAGMEPIK